MPLESADVTVVICTRDRPEFLRECLVSVTAHLAPEAELVVVDSASVDARTREITIETGARYVRSDIPGLSIARNLGLRTATRPIVLFTDDDCLLVRDVAGPIADAFDRDDVGGAAGRMIDHRHVEAVEHHQRRRLTRTIQGLDAGHGAAMAVRRELALELGGFDELLGAGMRHAGAEDLDMFCRILRHDRVIVQQPDCQIVHANTRDPHAYRRLQHGYGLGLGAMVAKWRRIDPATARRILAKTMIRALRQLKSPRSSFGRRPVLALIRGVLAGQWSGRRIPVSGGLFVPPHPAAPTPPACATGGTR